MPLSHGTWPTWIDSASGAPKHLSKNLVTSSKLLSAGTSGDTHLNTQRIEFTVFSKLYAFILYIRGVGAMEIVAMDMKLRGMYIARQLSFTGVTFKIEEVPLSQKYISMYNKSVKLVRHSSVAQCVSFHCPYHESLSSFVSLSGCVHVRSFSRLQTWLTQSNAWRSLCGVSSGLLIRGSLNTSVLPPKSAEWSSWPERRSRMERYQSIFRDI